MNKIINAIIIGLLGSGCFSGGIYYGIERNEHYLESVMEEYEVISNKVDAFEKVSDPKTIRLYVKELNKILDEILFLGYIVETGQIADEALTGFFETYQNKFDSVNDRILELNKEHMESVNKFNSQIAGLSADEDDLFEITEELQKRLQEQSDYISKLNVEISQSVKQLEDNVQTIKSSRYGKKIWKNSKSKIIDSNLEINNPYPIQDDSQQDTFNNQRPR